MGLTPVKGDFNINCSIYVCSVSHSPSVTLNFGGELVYPEAESTSASLISAIPDAWGFIVIEVVQAILNGFQDVSILNIWFIP